MSNIKKSITVNIPAKISDLRIHHLRAFELLENTKEWSITKKIELIDIYCSLDSNKLRDADVKSLIKLFDKIVGILASYKQKELPLSIKLDGVEFELQEDFSRLPVGWFIDASSVDFKETPELLPAFCYIEKGMSYAEKDKHKNIKNPLKNRAKIFKEHLPLDLFLDLSGFFLLKQKAYNDYFMANPKLKRNPKSELHLIGRTLST